MVVADEMPGLHRAGIGHLIGLPAIDAWWLRALGLDREFVDMVLKFDVDLGGRGPARPGPTATGVPIWNRLGYCLVRSGRRVAEMSEDREHERGYLNMATASIQSPGREPLDGRSAGVSVPVVRGRP